MAKGDITSLPAWARKLVEDAQAERDLAQRDLASYIARHTVALEDSAVVAEPYSECPTPLGDSIIEFRMPDLSFKVKLDVERGELEVRAEGKLARNDGLAVFPHSMNTVHIRGIRP